MSSLCVICQTSFPGGDLLWLPCLHGLCGLCCLGVVCNHSSACPVCRNQSRWARGRLMEVCELAHVRVMALQRQVADLEDEALRLRSDLLVSRSSASASAEMEIRLARLRSCLSSAVGILGGSASVSSSSSVSSVPPPLVAASPPDSPVRLPLSSQEAQQLRQEEDLEDLLFTPVRNRVRPPTPPNPSRRRRVEAPAPINLASYRRLNFDSDSDEL